MLNSVLARNMFASWKHKVDNGVISNIGSGAPTDGTTGAGFAGPGSTYTDITNNSVYVNIGTKASPIWNSINVGVVKQIRTRFTAAQLNAGATLLPAIDGYKYRIVDAAMIAIGGNAATATTVDLKGTQGAAVVKLIAAAVAGLTRSAVLRMGATNSTVLADGASHTACDANTAITVAVTTNNLATATHVDFIVDYVIEKA